VPLITYTVPAAYKSRFICEKSGLTKGDGRYLKLLTSFAGTDLLVLEDYGLFQLNSEQCHDLLEILEDRHGYKSTLVTSQLSIDHRHEQIDDPTLLMPFSTNRYTMPTKSDLKENL